MRITSCQVNARRTVLNALHACRIIGFVLRSWENIIEIFIMHPYLCYYPAPSSIGDWVLFSIRDRPKPVFLVSAVAESGAVTEVQLWP